MDDDAVIEHMDLLNHKTPMIAVLSDNSSTISSQDESDLLV